MKLSQEKKILAHLKSGRSLTALQALNKFQCLRLASRIYDINRKLYPKKVKVTMIATPSGKTIAEYRI